MRHFKQSLNYRIWILIASRALELELEPEPDFFRGAGALCEVQVELGPEPVV